MSWDLEQSIDAAFAAYLATELSGAMRIYPSCSNEELQFPCVVCHAGEGENANDEACFNGHRKIQVALVVMIEATDELDAAGVKIKSALARISEARGEVMGAVARDKLHDSLNAINSPGVKFSMAHPTNTSDPRIEGRLFIAEINVEVIANPTAT
jgi:hypothetical protein